MNPDGISVFDLSPSEKLQLVEDLWDDLAAAPEAGSADSRLAEGRACPAKANLLKNPASALSWQEVQRRVRNRHGR